MRKTHQKMPLEKRLFGLGNRGRQVLANRTGVKTSGEGLLHPLLKHYRSKRSGRNLFHR